VRTSIFLVSASALAALLMWGAGALPPVGRYRGPYGDVANAICVPERHTTDAVAAVNFDIRGFDTLGEEFILFCSIVGASLLLRRHPKEAARPAPDRRRFRAVPEASDAVRVLSLLFIPPTILFGVYIVAHGQLTPGGGFQGGVILATAPLLVYLAGEFETFRRVASHALVEVGEAIGAGGYAVIGFLGILGGGAFLENTLPLGKTGDVFSSGTIALINAAVGLEVGAGLLLLLIAFLEEMVNRKEL